jgi:uncharacterized membrane protein
VNKHEFLAELRKGLSGLPKEDIEERVAFYGEMIEDRVEEGCSEEEAVSEIGNVEEIISQIVAETPITKIVKERVSPKRSLKAWEIVLLVLGFPVWFPVVTSLLSAAFSLYVSVWTVVISLWAVFAALVGCVFGGIVAGILFICLGHILPGIATVALALVCVGLSIFAFFGCKAATKGMVLLTKKLILWIKNLIIKRREYNE